MPAAIGGFSGSGFGGLGPTPFLGMPNMANPYFPSPMSYASPDPAPATVVKPGDKDGGRSGAAAEPVDGGRKAAAAAARKSANANSETKQGRSRGQPRVKALTSSAPARQSPRLWAGLAGNAAPVVAPVKDVDSVETGTAKKAAVKKAPVESAKKAEVKTAAKKASVETARKAPAANRAEKKLLPARTLRSSGTVDLTMLVEDKGARKKKAPPAAVAPEALPAKRQKREGDVVVDEGKVGVEELKEEVRQENGTLFEGVGNGGLDTDISDILNSLPKIYDASGEEARF